MTDETEEAPWDLLADALTSLDELDEPEVDPVLDVKERIGEEVDGEDPFAKVPLGQAENLIKVRRVVRALENGRLTKLDFLNTIRPLGRSLENGLKLVASSPVQKQLDELDEEERALFDNAQHYITVLHEGISRMLVYGDTDSMHDVREGLRIVEDSFRELDQVQDEAIELGRSTEE